MLSIAEGAKHETLKQIKQLGINNIIIRRIPLTEAQKVFARERLSRGLERSDVASLEKGTPTISYVAPLKEVRAAISASFEEDPLEILAVTGSYQLVKNLSVQQGRFIHNVDIERRNLVCILGAEAARLLGPEGRLGGTLRVEDRSYRIVGILEEREWMGGKNLILTARNYNRVVFIPLETGLPFFDTKEEAGEISEISVQVARDGNVQATAAVIRRS